MPQANWSWYRRLRPKLATRPFGLQESRSALAPRLDGRERGGVLLEDRRAARGDRLELRDREGLLGLRQRGVLQVLAVRLAVRHEPLQQVDDRLALGGVGLVLADDDPT